MTLSVSAGRARTLRCAALSVIDLSQNGVRARGEEQLSDDDATIAEIRKCATFIGQLGRGRRWCSSYVWKHRVERAFGDGEHVNNGSFLAAAIGLGHSFRLCAAPNARFCFNGRAARVV